VALIPLAKEGALHVQRGRGNPTLAGGPFSSPVAKAGGCMNERSVMKFGYVRQILGSIRKHRGEPALVLVCLITISIVYVWAATSLQLRVSDITRELAIGVVGSLLPLVAMMLVLQFAVASWRLYRNQQIALATKQTLLDLNAFDRAESEHKLQAYHVKQVEGLQGRYESDLTRLEANIAALTRGLRGGQQ
jgi:hypothetical protein